MPTDGLDKARIDELFASTLERPPGERSAFLDESCGRPEEGATRRAVEELLALAEEDGLDSELEALRDGSLVRDLARSVLPDASAEGSDPLPGDRIGEYRIVEELGRGGMGVVYLAERAEGEFEQRLAIKLLRAGLAGDSLGRGFDDERSILASLTHPHVARLYGGGSTADGRPFFTMEYVEGRPIDRYCHEQRLSVDARIELFVKVVRAVHYAHRNLVVHRDIKPSNILVGADGEPKLLDFGIARLVDPREEAPALTRRLDRRLTPEYASPELLRGERVTTASDVYQLGLVLYELLAGRPAQAAPTGSAPSAAQWEELVCEREPKRPSITVTRDGDAALSTAAPPGRLARLLRGDLDNVVLTALAKEPERRYASAEDLARDLERYGADLPVTARGSKLSYRARKFVKRHRAAVVGAAAVLLALVAGLVGTVRQGAIAREQRDRARIEAATAQRVTEFLIDLFAVVDPSEARGRTLTAEEILRRGAERIERSLAEEPEVRARLLAALGRVHHGLGSHAEADQLLREAVRLRQETLGADHPETIESMVSLGWFLADRRDNQEGESVFREALALHDEAGRDDDASRALLLRGLGRAMYGQGRLPEAQAETRRALTMQEAAPETPSREVATTVDQLAVILHSTGELEDAEPLYRRALALFQSELGDDHPSTLTSLGNLATLMRSRGDLEAAEPLQRRALEARRRLFGDEHEKVASAAGNLGNLLNDMGRYEEAEELNREALAIRQGLYGARASGLTLSWINIGYVLHQKGDLAGALDAYATAVEMGELGDRQHIQLGIARFWHGRALAETGRHAAAAAELRGALEIYEGVYGAEDAWALDARIALADSFVEIDRLAEAERLLDVARELAAPGSEQAGAAIESLAVLYERTGRAEQAAALRNLLDEPAEPSAD